MTTWSPVPILMYHAVKDRAYPKAYKHIHVTKAEFEWQMRSLKARGYSPISFSALHEALAGRATLAAKSVLLTFDDGYEELLANAHPVLEELGFPYTVFLVSGVIGKTNNWDAFEEMAPFKILSWDQIRQMQASGLASFQPHTDSHPRLSTLPIEEARREICVSRDVLEQELGTRTDVFCYPYGDLNSDVASLVSDLGFSSAVTTQFGRVRRQDDPIRLPRISVYHVPAVSLTYGIGALNYWWRIESHKDNRP